MTMITIKINVPDEFEVSVDALPNGKAKAAPSAPVQDVERYWRDYLSDNGRRLYEAAAEQERSGAPGYTLHDVAKKMGVKYESAKSIHRTTGRSAKRWKRDNGTDVPIRLDCITYEWDAAHNGNRAGYRLPDGVADAIKQF
jgi:hypothetical protein